MAPQNNFTTPHTSSVTLQQNGYGRKAQMLMRISVKRGKDSKAKEEGRRIIGKEKVEGEVRRQTKKEQIKKKEKDE